MKTKISMGIVALFTLGHVHAQLIVTNSQFLPGTAASYNTIEQRDIVPGESFSIDVIDSDSTVYLLNEQTTTYTMPKAEVVSNYDGSELVIKEGSEVLSLLYHLENATGSKRANIQFDVEVPNSWFGASFGSAAGFGSAATSAALANTDYVSPGVFWTGGARGMEGVNELPKITDLGSGKYRVTVNARVASCCMDEMRIFAIRANPWGYFNGLIENASPTTLNTGLARITVNRVNQSFSAVYYYNGRYYRNRGRLDANFAWSGTVAGRPGYPPIAVNLQVEFNTAKNYIEIVGDIDGGSTFAAPIAPHIDPLCPSPDEGKYTALTTPPASPDADTPGGYGHFVGNVNRFGRLTLTGRAGDGMTLGRGTASVYQRPDKTVPMFMNTNYFVDGLDAQRGSMLGELAFRDVANVSDFDGELRWYKPAGSRSFRFRHHRSHYEAGFALDGITMIGSRYDPALGCAATTATVAGANLPADVTGSASVTSAAINLASPDMMVRKFYPVHGHFIGRYAHAGMITPRGKIPWAPFYGVIFQKQDLAAGVAIGPEEMGEVIFD
jgi:hypothetical protein